jgi:predicted nucleic-acid-binding protein
MRAVDTNVLLRILAQDDVRQASAAEQYIAGGAWVPTLAVAEALWVLRRAYGRDARALADLIEMLLNHETLVLQDREVVMEALSIFLERPALGFSDSLMLATARQAGHLPLGTFDKRLASVEGAERIP